MGAAWKPLGSLAAVVVLLGLAGPSRGMGPVDAPETPSVEGTEWVGNDGPSQFITTFRFEPGGVLAYSYSGRSYRNGTWKQDGDQLYFEMNEKFRQCKATIKGDVIQGDSWNNAMQEWKSTLYKYNKPD